ncbi:MAG: GTPase RsgA, partial [Planctomycetota bacterium]
MGNRHKELRELGWNDWFEQRAECGPDETVARVAAVDRDRLLLVDGNGQFPGRLAGRYMHHHHRAEEMPCVGDWVTLSKQPGGGFGVIHGLLERRTSLRRKAAGNVTGQQMIAANVDYVMVVQSCDYDFNLKRLERYLVMVLEGGAEPFILLTKTDLVDPEVLESQRGALRAAGITAPVIALSNVTREGLEDF